MASLKEVKNRISSVNSTRKITSAMKMVASSKLHHAQQAIEQMLPYEQKLHGIMSSFVASLEGELSSPYAVQREVKRVAIIVLSSNSSLCGGFNVNVIKQLKHTLENYAAQGIEVTHIYPIGRKPPRNKVSNAHRTIRLCSIIRNTPTSANCQPTSWSNSRRAKLIK